MVFNMALKQTSLELVLHSYLIDVIHNCHWLAHGRDFGHTRKCIDDVNTITLSNSFNF